MEAAAIAIAIISVILTLIFGVLGVFNNVATWCAPSIKQKFEVFFYKKNIRKLEHLIDELDKKKTHIEYRLALEKRQRHVPTPQVAAWLQTVQNLEVETSCYWKRANLKCFLGLCPDWQNRYQLNKEVMEKISTLENLIKEAERFEGLVISNAPLPPPVEQITIPDYVETDQSKLLMRKIMDALADESVAAIGVWGTGGVGKTTLVNKLNNHLKSDYTFDKIITVTISASPDWKNIHKQIAERLGLNLVDSESDHIRVNALSQSLRKEKSYLFILDDVWMSFDSYLLGIPIDRSDIKYKIVITTRSREVCDQMGVKKMEQFELSPMSKIESWSLFKAKVGDVATIPALHSIATQVCDKCSGLPLAICTLAKALKGDESETSWNDALRELQSSDQSGILGILKPVLKCIEFSFNRLPSEDMKHCFLFCCSYPEDHRIYKAFIREYLISQKLIKERNLNEALEKAEVLMIKLNKCSLLQVEENGNYAFVHDIVRQVGKWIASKDKYQYIIKSDQELIELSPSEDLFVCKRLALSRCVIDRLPSKLSCPNLLSLNLWGLTSNSNIQFTEDFFVEAQKLQYLDMDYLRFSSIPNSLYHLSHLRVLSMEGCKNLLNISSLEKLLCLEVLNLNDTRIQELPKELGNLKSLRGLFLENTTELKRVAPNIIKVMCRLEELEMKNSFNQWQLTGGNGLNAYLSEILCLSKLTSLNRDILNPRCLEHDYIRPSFENLEYFRILVGSSRDLDHTDEKFRRRLSLANLPFHMGNWICKLFETTQYLNLCGSNEIISLPYGKIVSFNFLKELGMSNLCLMKHIVDCDVMARGFGKGIFPCLEKLKLEDMDILESVINSSQAGVMFPKLKDIEIRNCKNLRFLFERTTNQAPQNLKVIIIHGCDQLENLMDKEGPLCFQSVKKVEIHDCGNMVNLLSTADWNSLETLSVARCRNLHNIFQRTVYPQNLRNLMIKECNKLTTSVSSLIQHSLSTIETIKVFDCNPGNAKYLLSTKDIELLPDQNIFENLKILKVRGFDGKGIFRGLMSQCSLKNLVEVKIIDCNVLKRIWSSHDTFAALKSLQNLMILGLCDKLILEEVFLPKGMGNQFALRVDRLFLRLTSSFTSFRMLPQASLKYVKVLEVGQYENWKYVLSHRDACALNSLRELYIDSCPNLERITSQKSVHKGQVESSIEEEFDHLDLAIVGERNPPIKNIHRIYITNCVSFNLVTLELDFSKVKDLILKKLPQLESLTQLKSLDLDTIRVLECENLEQACIVGDVEKLVLYDCVKLIALICEEEILALPITKPQDQPKRPINPTITQSTFNNLNFLLIGDCHALKNIFSLTTARSLVNLETILVLNCNEMQEIVAISDSIEGEAVFWELFPRLKMIDLVWLPKLKYFCGDNATPLLWPSLEYVWVWDSPSLITLGMGALSAPKLKEILGQEDWFENIKNGSSFPSRFTSKFMSITYSDALIECSTYDDETHSATYTSKLKDMLKKGQQ